MRCSKPVIRTSNLEMIFFPKYKRCFLKKFIYYNLKLISSDIYNLIYNILIYIKFLVTPILFNFFNRPLSILLLPTWSKIINISMYSVRCQKAGTPPHQFFFGIMTKKYLLDFKILNWSFWVVMPILKLLTLTQNSNWYFEI